MPTEFRKRTAVVTGASSGIGWSLAEALAREGARVGLIARREDQLRLLAERIQKAGGEAAPARADVGERSECQSAFRAIREQLGPVDLLIANAGVGIPTLLEPINIADVEKTIRVNLLGVIYAIEAVLPEMLQRREGHLVAISSMAAYKGLPGESAYCASKAAVNTYMEGLRIQLAGRNIAVTTVCPGFIRTPMTAPNTFAMPWLLEADDAARRIVRAIRVRRKVYNFPWQMALLMKVTRWLPDWAVMRNMSAYNESPPMPPESGGTAQGNASAKGGADRRMTRPLEGRTVALMEGRQLEELARMLEQEGAIALRCPMLQIVDAPDVEPVVAWIRELIDGRFAYVVFLTGEGIRRLVGFADRVGLREALVEALGRARTVTRGPKPVRALKELGLAPTLVAGSPTTAGVIAALRDKPLQGAVVGVQLYAEPIADLMEFIEKSGALARCVRPYVYAAAADTKTVAELIGRVAQGEVDVIVFTSSPQVDRFYEVIESEGLANGWREGSKRVRLAAVGPVVAEALRVRGNTVAICPDQGWVMKNLVQHIRREMGRGSRDE